MSAPRRRWRLALGLVGAVLALVLAVAPFSRAPRSLPRAGGAAPTPTTPAFPADAIPLRLAIHVKNLYNLQLDNQTFSADGWYWLQWDQRLEDLIQSAQIAYDRLVEFDNQIDLADASIEAETTRPTINADGSRQLMFRFSGHFYIDRLDLHNSPFDKVVLPLVLETRPELFSASQQPVRLEPAKAQYRLVGDYGDVAGYELRGATLKTGVNVYEGLGREKAQAYSQLGVRVTYGTDFLAAFLKWMLPLLIVMIVVLLAPSLEGSLGDIRLAIPSTALLTLVFLQQTYRAELPATPYPTFLDQIYAYSYLVAVGLFLLFVWSSNTFEDTPEPEREAVRQRINRVDAICQRLALGGFLVWTLLAWFF